MIDKDPKEYGFIFTRREDGEAETNVPQLVVVHSPDGFEWGYGGSGPADLALNICEYVLREAGFKGPVGMGFEGRGHYFMLSWSMHQELKQFFIANIPYQGGVFTYKNVENWVLNKMLMEYIKDNESL